MSTPEDTQAKIGATDFIELFRRYAKIEIAQEQLSGVTGHRLSLATGIASAVQQLATLQAEIKRLEAEDAALATEQKKLEAWLSVNAPIDAVALDKQVLAFIDSMSTEPVMEAPGAGHQPGRGRFNAIESELHLSGWVDDGTGLTVRRFSAAECDIPGIPEGYVYVQLKANEAGPILTDAGEQTLIVSVALPGGGLEHERRSDFRRKVLDDLNGPAVGVVSKLNAKADELIDAVVAESLVAMRDSRSPSDDLREVFQAANCDSHFVASATFPAGAGAHEVVGHLADMPGFDDSSIDTGEINEVKGFGGTVPISEAVYDEIPGFADDVERQSAPVLQEQVSAEYQFDF